MIKKYRDVTYANRSALCNCMWLAFAVVFVFILMFGFGFFIEEFNRLFPFENFFSQFEKLSPVLRSIWLFLLLNVSSVLIGRHFPERRNNWNILMVILLLLLWIFTKSIVWFGVAYGMIGFTILSYFIFSDNYMSSLEITCFTKHEFFDKKDEGDLESEKNV